MTITLTVTLKDCVDNSHLQDIVDSFRAFLAVEDVEVDCGDEPDNEEDEDDWEDEDDDYYD